MSNREDRRMSPRNIVAMAQQSESSKGEKGPAGGPKNQGFENMDPEKQREISRKGGQHSHDNDPGRSEGQSEKSGGGQSGGSDQDR